MQQTKSRRLTLSGGVSCNRALRENLRAACQKNGIEFLVAEPWLCTDNAAMIVFAAMLRWRLGFNRRVDRRDRSESCAEVIFFCRVARASRVLVWGLAETIFKVRETETVSPTRETRALPGSSPDQTISTRGRGDNLRVLAAAQLLCQKF